MKTSELTGAALDWAVAKCEGLSTYIEVVEGFKPTTDWMQGGPIIEREKIDVWNHAKKEWAASNNKGKTEYRGDTPLIAAMRCYVASKLGDQVEVPAELKGVSV